jgi:GMP synthase-like glutamine amidotransferase
MVVAEDFVDNSILQADFQIFPVFADILPDHPHVCEAWIVTGSKYDVYGGMPWIAKLETFIQKVCSSNIPIAGICFGHQIIARAMGGIVKKSPNGWGLGVDTYYLRQQPCWQGFSTGAHWSIPIVLIMYHPKNLLTIPLA